MKEKEKLLRVYCDFDGTITEKEICLELAKEYCPNYEEVLTKLVARDITLKTAWKTLIHAIPKTLSYEEAEAFCDRFEPLVHFKELYQYCKSMDIPFKIISDGFDLYIRRILANAGLSEIEFFTNKIVEKEDGFDIIFPGASESCECDAASCKRNVIINDAPTDSIIIYIGDGISDYCAVKHSDINFAKKRLAKHCSVNKIPFYPYKSFYDVHYRIEEIIKKGKIKQRNQAVVLRKKAFEIE